MDQDHVSHPQGHCLVLFMVIVFMMPCFLLLKQVSPPMGLPNAVPPFLDVLGGSGFGYQFWGKSGGDVNGELGLSSIH